MKDNARNNLIRGLMRRGARDECQQDLERALEHAKLSAGLQPEVAEMQYQLGVVLMQQNRFHEAALAYETTLKMQAGHRGALVNGIHCLQQLPPSDKSARKRLKEIAQAGVQAALWTTWCVGEAWHGILTCGTACGPCGAPCVTDAALL